MIAGGDDGTNKVYLYDFQGPTITMICSNAGPTGGSLGPLSDGPAISGDGRFVVYRTAVTNAVPGDTNPPPNLFLYDRLAGTNGVLTAGQGGTSPVLWVSRGAISGSGATVAFLDLGSGLVSSDLNRVQDAFAFSVDIGTALDSDADGIPDWWMNLYFGHPTGQAGDLSRAQDDADGDGLSNLQEYLAGTIPIDPSSVLRLDVSSVVYPAGNVTLSWPAVPGKSYQVVYKDDLSDPTWLNAPGSCLGGWQTGLISRRPQPSRTAITGSLR